MLKIMAGELSANRVCSEIDQLPSLQMIHPGKKSIVCLLFSLEQVCVVAKLTYPNVTNVENKGSVIYVFIGQLVINNYTTAYFFISLLWHCNLPYSSLIAIFQTLEHIV